MKLTDMFSALGRPIYISPGLVKVLGSVEAAVYLAKMVEWTECEAGPDGFVCKTKAEIEEATALTIRQQDRVRKTLEAKGIIEKSLRRVKTGETILFYRIGHSGLAKAIAGSYS